MSETTFLAILLPSLAAAVVLANWLMLREIRRRCPAATKRERLQMLATAWSTAGLSLMEKNRDDERRP